MGWDGMEGKGREGKGGMVWDGMGWDGMGRRERKETKERKTEEGREARPPARARVCTRACVRWCGSGGAGGSPTYWMVLYEFGYIIHAAVNLHKIINKQVAANSIASLPRKKITQVNNATSYNQPAVVAVIVFCHFLSGECFCGGQNFTCDDHHQADTQTKKIRYIRVIQEQKHRWAESIHCISSYIINIYIYICTALMQKIPKVLLSYPNLLVNFQQTFSQNLNSVQITRFFILSRIIFINRTQGQATVVIGQAVGNLLQP
jgi:hypothetical protein